MKRVAKSGFRFGMTSFGARASVRRVTANGHPLRTGALIATFHCAAAARCAKWLFSPVGQCGSKDSEDRVDAHGGVPSAPRRSVAFKQPAATASMDIGNFL